MIHSLCESHREATTTVPFGAAVVVATVLLACHSLNEHREAVCSVALESAVRQYAGIFARRHFCAAVPSGKPE